MNDDIKQRNDKFITQLIAKLVAMQSLIPIGDLIIFCHAANGLGYDWEKSTDDAEIRNYTLFKSLNPHIEPRLLNAKINGSFKPESFIHPFDTHNNTYYTLPGYWDEKILALFFDTTDHLAQKIKANQIKVVGSEFLSFIYIFFLLIHPFIDGNGRVARNLLDYYNQSLNFNLQNVWNGSRGKFSEQSFHKQAFDSFYTEAQLKPIARDQIYLHSLEVRLEHAKMADYLRDWAVQVHREESVVQHQCVNIMEKGITELQG